MKKKTIYIPIEWRNREFDSYILFAHFAIKRNYRVLIGAKRPLFDYLKKKREKGGIYIEKGGLEKKMCEFINEKCDAHAVIDQEIGPINNYRLSFKIPTRFYFDTLKFIDLYFCVSKRVYKIAKDEILKKMRGKIVLAGWPRIDLWKPKSQNFYQKESDEIKQKYKNYYLFSSNFICTDLNQIKRYSKRQDLNHWKNTNAYDEIPALIKRLKNGYKEFILFKKFLKEYEKTKGLPKLVIRPHPSENIDHWRSSTKGFKNIKIERKFDITPWINCSEAVLHRGCTSSVQGLIAKKKVIFIKLQKRILLHKENISDKISTNIISNPNQLKKKLNMNFNEKINFLKKNGYLYIKEDSGKTVIKEFQRLKKVRKEELFKYNFIDKNIYYLKSFFYFLKSFFLLKRYRHKNPEGFKKEYVISKFKLANLYYNKINKINNNLLLIE